LINLNNFEFLLRFLVEFPILVRFEKVAREIKSFPLNLN